jgi:hypothetical protein
MLRKSMVAAAAAAALLSGCAGGEGGGGLGGIGGYQLAQPRTHHVARGRMEVTPTIPWNRAYSGYNDISEEENWTLNGPLLDNLTFIGGLRDNRPIVRFQRRSDWRQVPNFRSTMTPDEIVSMIETYFRVRGGVVRFETAALQPRSFLGHPGFQFDYTRLGTDEVERRGRAAAAVIGGRLYLILFDAARMHYFPAALPEVERIIESARLRQR